MYNDNHCGKCNKKCPYGVKCDYGSCGYAWWYGFIKTEGREVEEVFDIKWLCISFNLIGRVDSDYVKIIELDRACMAMEFEFGETMTSEGVMD